MTTRRDFLSAVFGTGLGLLIPGRVSNPTNRDRQFTLPDQPLGYAGYCLVRDGDGNLAWADVPDEKRPDFSQLYLRHGDDGLVELACRTQPGETVAAVE